jgi:hypothetical protein
MSGIYQGSFITVTKTGVTQASSGSSAGGTIPLDSSGNVPKFIRVAATAAACIRLGPGAQTAVTSDLQVQPGDAVVMMVPSGYTNYAVIQVAAAGVVQISPLDMA